MASGTTRLRSWLWRLRETLALAFPEGVNEGYRFEIGRSEPGQLEWWVRAWPVEPGVSGQRYFYVDMSGQILQGKTELSAFVALRGPVYRSMAGERSYPAGLDVGND